MSDFGHLYCFRKQLPEANLANPQRKVEVVLFNGWKKDKSGKAEEEKRRIQTAKTLCEEYLAEKGGNQ